MLTISVVTFINAAVSNARNVWLTLVVETLQQGRKISWPGNVAL